MIEYFITTFFLTNIFISNTTGMPDACCEGEGWYSISTQSGLYLIERDESLNFLFLYSQVPLKLLQIIDDSKTLVNYSAPNMMFYTDQKTVIKVTKFN